MKYFTSDIHFSDKTTMKLDNRPFASIEKYDKFIIKSLNKRIKKTDTLYVVGDLLDCDDFNCKSWEKSIKYIRKINAQIILIIGNNEERIIENFFDGNFENVRQMCIAHGIKDVVKNMIVEFNGLKFFLTHKPKDHNPKYINLFGHLHRSRGTWFSFGLNVSCDLNNFMPYSEDDILFQLDQKSKYYNNDPNFKVL